MKVCREMMMVCKEMMMVYMQSNDGSLQRNDEMYNVVSLNIVCRKCISWTLCVVQKLLSIYIPRHYKVHYSFVLYTILWSVMCVVWFEVLEVVHDCNLYISDYAIS